MVMRLRLPGLLAPFALPQPGNHTAHDQPDEDACKQQQERGIEMASHGLSLLTGSNDTVIQCRLATAKQISSTATGAPTSHDMMRFAVTSRVFPVIRPGQVHL
jgi:hypothetical protein